MNDLREAAKQALWFCEFLWREAAWNDWAEKQREETELALRAALAQPSVEPVAYWISKAEQFSIAKQGERPFAKAWQPLYAAPQPAPARVPLSSGEIARCMLMVDDPLLWGRMGDQCGVVLEQFARAI